VKTEIDRQELRQQQAGLLSGKVFADESNKAKRRRFIVVCKLEPVNFSQRDIRRRASRRVRARCQLYVIGMPGNGVRQDAAHLRYWHAHLNETGGMFADLAEPFVKLCRSAQVRFVLDGGGTDEVVNEAVRRIAAGLTDLGGSFGALTVSVPSL
jgi:hypothetical protein